MYSLCKTCNHKLSTNAEFCIKCGEKDPFNRKAISSLERRLAADFFISRQVPSYIVGIAAPLMAIYYRSWIIFFIGVGLMAYFYREALTDDIHYDDELEELVRESYKNYLIANKNQNFDDNFEAERSFSKNILNRGGPIYMMLHDAEEIFNEFYLK